MPQGHTLTVDRETIELGFGNLKRCAIEYADQRFKRVGKRPARNHTKSRNDEKGGEHCANTCKFPVNRGPVLIRKCSQTGGWIRSG
jgi:hypothetical protein